jgi:GNAT superfamily N-acetyltransferase
LPYNDTDRSLALIHTIVQKEEASQDDVTAIATHLQQFNFDVGPSPGYHTVVLQLVTPEGKVTGGLFGQIAYEWLHIAALIVPAEARGTGLGRALMLRAEQIALGRNCVGIYLETLAFQALPFYEKLGYTRFGHLDDHPRGSTHYFLQKRFDSQPTLACS